MGHRQRRGDADGGTEHVARLAAQGVKEIEGKDRQVAGDGIQILLEFA
jgi:hypothetical protein